MHTLNWQKHVYLLLALVASAIDPPATSGVVLYDASLNSQPDDQQWVYLANGPVNREITGGATRLDTTAVTNTQAGYFSFVPLLGSHPNIPTMDLSTSDWLLRFTLRIASGTDTPDTDSLAIGERNRGAFSLIAITDDQHGVELVFQPDNVIVLDDSNTAFPIGEVKPFNSTGDSRTYELLLQDRGYTLFVTDSSLSRQSILNGPLRNYGPVAPDLQGFVYSTPNFIFFGDDTPRGAGDFRLGLLEAVPVPEPSAAFLGVHVLLAAGGFAGRHHRRSL